MPTDHTIVNVDLGPRSYNIHVGPGLLDQLGSLTREVSGASRITIITDKNVAPHYSRRAVDALEAAGFAAKTITIPPGESSKSLDTAARLYDGLAERRQGRHDPIVALGGGVVGDLAGFVAATWMRGVPFVQVPTTTESMIDAGVGGKTAVNHASGKNQIGAFHQPRLVLMDIETTRTLSDRDFRAGLAESVKHALIANPPFLDWHASNRSAILDRDPETLTQLIARNCTIKAEVVRSDEREEATQGVGRAALNFGHTVGHALEAAAKGELRHGEAISLGMIAALKLSIAKFNLPAAILPHATSVLESLQLPVKTALAFNPDELVTLMQRDKKNTDQLRLVLLKDAGKPAWFSSETVKPLLSAIFDIIGR